MYGCIGKSLALIQLRAVISLVALTFDLEFAVVEDGRAFDEEALDSLSNK